MQSLTFLKNFQRIIGKTCVFEVALEFHCESNYSSDSLIFGKIFLKNGNFPQHSGGYAPNPPCFQVMEFPGGPGAGHAFQEKIKDRV